MNTITKLLTTTLLVNKVLSGCSRQDRIFIDLDTGNSPTPDEHYNSNFYWITPLLENYIECFDYCYNNNKEFCCWSMDERCYVYNVGTLDNYYVFDVSHWDDSNWVWTRNNACQGLDDPITTTTTTQAPTPSPTYDWENSYEPTPYPTDSPTPSPTYYYSYDEPEEKDDNIIFILIGVIVVIVIVITIIIIYCICKKKPEAPAPVIIQPIPIEIQIE